MKVLITGGAGFIPSSLAYNLLEKLNCEVILVDNMLTGEQKNIPENKNCHFFNADVNEFDQIKNIFLNFKIDYIFHYAAVVGVKRTIENPIMVLNDVEGIKNILSLSVEHNVKKVFLAPPQKYMESPLSFQCMKRLHH